MPEFKEALRISEDMSQRLWNLFEEARTCQLWDIQ